MGDLLKGIHLLPQSDFETAVENNQIDDDVIYVTPEDFSSLSREQAKQIAKNTEDITTNKINIENNAAAIESLKNSSGGSSEDLVEIKNTIQEIILRDISQDSRLDDIENDYATEEFVIENGGKIDKITVNGIEQIIADKTVNLVIPDTSSIEDRLAKTVNLDEAQTIIGPKTFTEHIYLANADGTVDRISHLNNNFMIHSGATNSSVLNIDEGLEKIYAFNKELAFKSDIAETSGTTIYVDGTAVADLRFSADPQTQINLLAESIEDDKAELNTNIAAKVSKSGDTISGELIASGGIIFGNNKVNSENSGNTLRIYHIENNEEYDILNYTHGGMLTVNNAETPLILQGYDDRPTYVSGSGIMSDLALESDIPTKVSELTNDANYDTVTSVDNKISSNLTTAKSYTDTKIANLVDSAPETLDTLAEVAQAIRDNETVVDALNSAIGDKADKTTVDSLTTRMGYAETNITNLQDNKADKTSIPESVELYSETGTNTDGAMTQKATTTALNGKQKVIETVTITPGNGTLTTTQLATLKASDENYIYLKEFGPARLCEKNPSSLRYSLIQPEQIKFVSVNLDNGNYFTTTETRALASLSNVTYPTNTAGSTKTGAGDRVIETYISGDCRTWYRKWASGWKECGTKIAGQSAGTTNVTLPIEFSVTPKVFVQSITTTTTTNDVGATFNDVIRIAGVIKTLTNSEVVISTASSNGITGGYDIYAMGY